MLFLKKIVRRKNKKINQQDEIPVFGGLTEPIFGKLPGDHIILIFGALPTPPLQYVLQLLLPHEISQDLVASQRGLKISRQ